MEKDWGLIFSTVKLYESEIVKSVLEDNEIEVVVINKQDSIYLFGEIEVYVKADDVIRAKFLIKDI